MRIPGIPTEPKPEEEETISPRKRRVLQTLLKTLQDRLRNARTAEEQELTQRRIEAAALLAERLTAQDENNCLVIERIILWGKVARQQDRPHSQIQIAVTTPEHTFSRLEKTAFQSRVEQIRTDVEEEIDRPDEITFKVTILSDRVLEGDDYPIAKAINNDGLLLWPIDAEE